MFLFYFVSVLFLFLNFYYDIDELFRWPISNVVFVTGIFDWDHTILLHFGTVWNSMRDNKLCEYEWNTLNNSTSISIFNFSFNKTKYTRSRIRTFIALILLFAVYISDAVFISDIQYANRFPVVRVWCRCTCLRLLLLWLFICMLLYMVYIYYDFNISMWINFAAMSPHNATHHHNYLNVHCIFWSLVRLLALYYCDYLDCYTKIAWIISSLRTIQ